MQAQDGVRGDQATTSQCSGQPPDEGGETARSAQFVRGRGFGAAKDGDLVSQHEQFDVFGGGRAAHQQDQPESL